MEHTLAGVRDFARFLCTERGKTDWAAVQVDDVEAFLGQLPLSRQKRLGCLRQFFVWAKKNKVVLVDPTAGISGTKRKHFSGTTLTIEEQRRLLRRWTLSADDVHPHEALIGVLALLHALTLAELRSIRVDGIDLREKRLLLPGRPYALPLDPVSFTVIEKALAHRDSLNTMNPHLIVTRGTKTRSVPASPAYVTHALDPAGTRPKKLRNTRLIDLVITLGPKVVGASLGMDVGGLCGYLADEVDEGRLG